MTGAISAIVLLASFTALLVFEYVGPSAYVALVAITLLASFGIALAPRLAELDLRNLRLVLRGIEEAKAELYAREEDLKHIAFKMTLILSFITATQGRWGGSDSHMLQSKWLQRRLADLASTFQFSESEQSDISKYVNMYNEFDAVMGDREGLRTTDPDYEDVKRRLGDISKEIDVMLRNDLKGEI